MAGSHGRRDGGLGWLVLGLGAGLAVGLVAGGFMGRGTVRRLGAAVRGLRPPAPPRAPSRRESQAAAPRALAADADLRDLALEPVSLSPGVIELHGWVPTRGARARAARVVRAAAGVEHVVNRLLVRGEDDRLTFPDADPADQTA